MTATISVDTPVEPVADPGSVRRTAAPPPLGSPPARRPRRARRRWRRWAVVAASIAMAVGLASVLRPDPVPVEVARAGRGPLTLTVEEDGRTRFRDRYVVSAPVAGTLLRVSWEPGDSIGRGDVVAHLVPLPAPMLDERVRAETRARLAAATAELERARAQVSRAADADAFARREAARQRALLAQGAVSVRQAEEAELAARLAAEDFRSAQSAVAAAEAAVAMHRATLTAIVGGGPAAGEPGRIVIRAPVDGIVLAVARESEGPVATGEVLVEVGDPSVLEVVVDLLTPDAARVRPGAPVTIERWGGDGALRGHVHRVEPAGFTKLSALGVEEQRVNVVVHIDSPRKEWRGLGDGFRVEARIELWTAPDVLTIPASAAFRSRGGWAVFRVRDGRAALVPVELGQRTSSLVEVRSGLAAGDTVIAYPGERVTDGVRVAPRARES